VFFFDTETMNNFYCSAEFNRQKMNCNTISEKNDYNAVKQRMIQSTRSRRITLLTRVFGRGVDFACMEKAVADAGGVHVIQTFISEEESEEVQIQGRTARQGQ
jgi:preprotein translocase subunit SecA